MCGIVGYFGKEQALRILLDGLRRLEYRGYDSAGLALLDGDHFDQVRAVGRVDALEKKVAKLKLHGSAGIAHTRWATHGGVTENNAHPHVSSDGKIALVHNGVIENYAKLKEFLIKKGYFFSSETDSEVVANLIAYYFSKNSAENGKSRFLKSVQLALKKLEGTYGIAVICTECPDEIIGARKSSPLLVGVGDDEYIISSDISAFAMRTRNVIYLKDGEIVHIKGNDLSVATIGDEVVEPIVEKIEWEIESAELGVFNHYMEKEIMEQPVTLFNSMRGRFSDDETTAHFGGLNLSAQELRQIDRIVFCACGTSWHACLVAEYLIEKYARIPVEVDYASEFRYRNAPLEKNTLVFVMSQSGETLDTLSALREAKRKGYKTLAITNVVGSTIARESDGGIYQRLGPEIGVASTKAFTSQILLSSMIALYLARLRDMSFEEGAEYVQALKQVPDQVQAILNQRDQIKAIADRFSHYNDFLYLGRQLMFPVALEGALKLKEISYIHAEGYPAAEMKHGPIALISPEFPTVFLAAQHHIFQKSLANIEEIRARGGPVIVIANEKAQVPAVMAENLITIPDAHDAVLPILASIPIQLLAYEIAVNRDCDVDKPRNLAKSVTVE